MFEKKPERMPDGSLSPAERDRFIRQIIIPEVGLAGQARLKRTSVLIVGAGGLGSPAAFYAAAAGFGRLGIIDPEIVEDSNLQRQILHFTSDKGKAKVESARTKLADLNPFMELDVVAERLSAANVLSVLKSYDIVIDGTDNIPARYLINDACFLLGKPWVYGSVQVFHGQLSVFDGRKGPCFRCLLPDPPRPDALPGCAESGVLGAVPGVVGTLQAVEAIKLALGLGKPLLGKILFFDALKGLFETIDVSKNPKCPLCGPNPSITAPVDTEGFCAPGTGSPRSEIRTIGVAELKRRIEAGEKFFFLDIQSPGETGDPPFPETLRLSKSEVLRRMPEIPRDREVIVLCRIGIQSREIIRELQDFGFTNLINLEGGTISWINGIF
jgi:sulfur-carrier protein adenylyltransferase/sulfurtransferase